MTTTERSSNDVCLFVCLFLLSPYRAHDFNWYKTRKQAQIQATDALMVEQEFMSGPVESWLTSFVTWAENSADYRSVRSSN